MRAYPHGRWNKTWSEKNTANTPGQSGTHVGHQRLHTNWMHSSALICTVVVCYISLGLVGFNLLVLSLSVDFCIWGRCHDFSVFLTYYVTDAAVMKAQIIGTLLAPKSPHTDSMQGYLTFVGWQIPYLTLILIWSHLSLFLFHHKLPQSIFPRGVNIICPCLFTSMQVIYLLLSCNPIPPHEEQELIHSAAR